MFEKSIYGFIFVVYFMFIGVVFLLYYSLVVLYFSFFKLGDFKDSKISIFLGFFCSIFE